jgi:hypothetical protein
VVGREDDQNRLYLWKNICKPSPHEAVLYLSLYPISTKYTEFYGCRVVTTLVRLRQDSPTRIFWARGSAMGNSWVSARSSGRIWFLISRVCRNYRRSLTTAQLGSWFRILWQTCSQFRIRYYCHS